MMSVHGARDRPLSQGDTPTGSRPPRHRGRPFACQPLPRLLARTSTLRFINRFESVGEAQWPTKSISYRGFPSSFGSLNDGCPGMMGGVDSFDRGRAIPEPAQALILHRKMHRRSLFSHARGDVGTAPQALAQALAAKFVVTWHMTDAALHCDYYYCNYCAATQSAGRSAESAGRTAVSHTRRVSPALSGHNGSEPWFRWLMM